MPPDSNIVSAMTINIVTTVLTLHILLPRWRIIMHIMVRSAVITLLL